MGDNREQTLERIPMDLASSSPVIKPDQPRSTPGAALLRSVPLSNQQSRYLPTNIQQTTAVISTSSSTQSHNVTKQTSVQRTESVPSVSPASGTALPTTAVINRLTALPVHSSSTSSYHVPRGAAAVANIAVPRSSVATPIIRGTTNALQTIGVATSANPPSGLRATTPTGRTTVQVAGSTSWLGVTTTTTSSQPTRQPTPTLSHTPTNTTFNQGRTTSMTVTTRLGPANTPLRLSDPPSRPVLLQAATHKQLSIAQPGTQVHIADKAYLKAGVVPVRPPNASLTYSGTNTSQGRLTVTNVTTQPTLSRLTAAPTLQPVVTSQPGLSRITAATTLQPVVSLHPAVLVPSPATVPLKAAPHQQPLGAKVITQAAHGPAIQIQSVPVSSVSQPTQIAITTVVTRPVGFPTTTTTGGQTGLGMRTAVSTPGQTPSANKVFPQSAPSEQSVFIQASHKSTQGTVTGSMVTIANPLYSLPTSGFPYETAGSFQVQRTFSTATTTVTTAPQSYSTNVQARQTNSQVHGIIGATGQPVRFNPVVVVDHNRSSVHSYVANEGSSVVQPTESPSGGGQNQTQPTLKQNASPRPSILRKRDTEGTPVKAQKNLTPLLSSLSVSTPSSPPSPPKRPESRGNGGGQSSGGSTTISATSSPGLGAGDPESPPIKQEPVEEERVCPPIEMSPRKKPRKQQLTGNQIHEPKFSEDEMEFISEEKIKKEPRDSIEENNEIAPKLIQKRCSISLLSSYRHTWKSRHHHFLRYSDVKPKEERRPTVSDIANQKQVLQKVNGWKVYHISTQMEDLSDLETEVFERLTSMLKVLEKKPGKEIDKDVNRVNELIKGNIQRSKVITDQLQEAKTQVMKIFDHKGHVTDIISRCASKRSVKKRDRKKEG